MKRTFFFLFFLGCGLPSFSQPKLVVGIVVDQMRYDYIQKYWNLLGEDGFKRLVKEGYDCKNTNYNYVPTFTGPGHASIYSGLTPSVHGIVSNEWVNKNTGKKIYCSDDSSATALGGKPSAGKMSPRNLLSSTVGEELQRAHFLAPKVIGIALKDRGAIFPAGHKANAAYWYDGSTGNWMTSTYYMKELPAWVTQFNQKELAKKYLSQSWTTLRPYEEYAARDLQDTACEETFKGKPLPMFPYDLPALMKKNGELGLIRNTPFGNSFTKDFAIETIKNEKMGKGQSTDMICISFSSTDYIGHQFGPHSVEVEDCYLRMDKDIADLLKFLDEWVGKGNVLVFLTSDHGAAEAVPCQKRKNIEAGSIKERTIADSLKKFILRTYKDTFLLAVNDFDVYLNMKKINEKKYDAREIRNTLAAYLTTLRGISDALTSDEIQERSPVPDGPLGVYGIGAKVKAGFYSQRSGDITFVLLPGWLEGYEKGTSHGSPYEYDTHVPLLWWGYTVKPGQTNEALTITQIAPTLYSLLKMNAPVNGLAKPIQFGK